MSEALIGQLAECLGELRGLYEQLVGVLRRKLEAMRRADTEGLNSCGARERFLVQRMAESDATRRNLVGELQVRAGVRAGQAMTLSDLAERLGEPARSRVLVLAAGLRQVVEEANQLNQVAALSAKEMLVHFGRVYEVMQSGGMGGGVYGPQGGRAQTAERRSLDAVG